MRLLQPITLESGAIYEGEWIDGKKDGYGTQQWIDGTIYEGFWENDKANGKVILFREKK